MRSDFVASLYFIAEILFEIFLGFEGYKKPDIDLKFSGEQEKMKNLYQKKS